MVKINFFFIYCKVDGKVIKKLCLIYVYVYYVKGKWIVYFIGLMIQLKFWDKDKQ